MRSNTSFSGFNSQTRGPPETGSKAREYPIESKKRDAPLEVRSPVVRTKRLPKKTAAPRRAPSTRAIVVTLFLAGLLARSVIFLRPHREGDEVIYEALVEQLDEGRGYTLQGHPILQMAFIAPETYGRKLFFHPPGGPGQFWLLHRIFGDAGFGLTELLAYALFFWAMQRLAAGVLHPISDLQILATAGLSAFTPILTHVTSRYWLDGPLLAASTAAAALFLAACRRDSLAAAAVAGGVLGFAALIKPTAFLIVPGLLAVAWVGGARDLRRLAILGGVFVGAAAVLLAPWQAYQWLAMGNPLAVAPGRPSAHLIAINSYVRYVTTRSPWIYVHLLPRAVWTLVPSLALLAWGWNADPVRRLGLALVSWIALVTAVHVALGYAGYSKVLRYVILVTPATVLLFALVTDHAWRHLRGRSRERGGRTLALALLTLAALGFVLEIAQGIKTPVVDNSDVIVPFWGPVH
jgi:4-amino-4-deoxy-L-arabinose transferase-like glycosyltransferase